MRPWRAAVVVLVIGSSLVAPTSEIRAAGAGCGGGPADFDGDGRDDLAIGVYGKDPNGKSSAGSVHVVYGSADGLTASGDQVFHEDVEGIADTAAPGDFFGWSLATGDFDGDGRDDLAVGVAHKLVSGLGAAGSVHVIYGSADGLTASGDQVFHQDTSGMAGEAGANEAFGSSLAACDFDGDGRDDLAVGVPQQVVNGETAAGAVHVIYGSAEGLTASGDQILDRDTTGVAGDAAEFDFVGTTMTAGDLDADGLGDLVVGCPFCDPSGKSSGGEVHVFYGSSAGLSASGDQIWHQDVPNINDTAVPFDRFARGLTTGDFNGDGRDDVAAGVAFKVVNGKDDAGAVHVIYGSSTGLSTAGDEVLHQDVADVADIATAGDFFGKALAAADYDGDGRDDLSVGVPGKGINSKPDAGEIHVFYGSVSGLTTTGNAVFHQDSSGIADQSAPLDEFGRTLSIGDYDDDGRVDLSVGVPFKDRPGSTDVGAVHVMNGSSAGLSASGDLVLDEDVSGMADEGEFLDFFGYVLVGHPFVD